MRNHDSYGYYRYRCEEVLKGTADIAQTMRYNFQYAWPHGYLAGATWPACVYLCTS